MVPRKASTQKRSSHVSSEATVCVGTTDVPFPPAGNVHCNASQPYGSDSCALNIPATVNLRARRGSAAARARLSAQRGGLWGAGATR
jgi:hypothetical protein